MLIISENERKKILPFASGKGGVGKTLIATNIAILIAQQGRKVLLVDVDLGGSNAHTYLHIKNQHYGIANYIYNDQLSCRDIIQETEYTNLHFIAGDALSPGVANINSEELEAALLEIVALPYDYIILDTASGSRSMSLGAFSLVNSGILVVNPNIASVLNAYNLFKNTIFNIMRQHTIAENKKEVSEYIQTITEEKAPNSTPKINEVLLELDRIDPQASTELREQIYCMKPFVILNGARSTSDLESVHNLKSLIYKNMNIELECLGAIFEDDSSVRRAMESKTPLVHTELESCARNNMERIAQKILLSPDFPILPLDLEMYSNTIELTEIEMQNDMEQYPQDIAALEREEYLALIETLEQKVSALEKQVPDQTDETATLESKNEQHALPPSEEEAQTAPSPTPSPSPTPLLKQQIAGGKDDHRNGAAQTQKQEGE